MKLKRIVSSILMLLALTTTAVVAQPGGGMGGGGGMSMGERPVRMPSVDITSMSDLIAAVLTDDQKIKFDAIIKEKAAQKQAREEKAKQMLERLQKQQQQ